MKKVKGSIFKALLVTLVLALCLVSGAVLAESGVDAASTSETLTFVHTNDVHGHLDIEPYVKAVADSYKATNGSSNVITTSSGDVFGGGEAIAHLTEGYAVADVMNAVGYDVMTMGNNDVLAQCGQIINLINDGYTKFPILDANIFSNGVADPSCKTTYVNGDQPFGSYEIFTTAGGAKVGVFGIGTCMADLPYYYTEGTIETSKKCVDALKAKGCDIIVGLTHTGWMDDLTSTSSNDVNSYQLAMAVPGIDLIIDGHTHSIINNGDGYVCDNTSKTLITQASYFGGAIGVVNTELDASHNINSKSASLLTGDAITKYTPDAGVLKVVEEWETKFSSQYETKIGYTKYFLNAERAAASADGKGIRRAEQNIGNLVTDALRAGTGADVALFGGGRIRASIKAGDITLLDLLNVFANGGIVCVQEMTGADLKVLLEESVAKACIDVENVDFQQVSGIQFVYDRDTGSVVSATKADGSKLSDTKTYKVACGPRDVPAGAKVYYDGYFELAACVQAYLQSAAYDTENYAGPEGRIASTADMASVARFTDISSSKWYYNAVSNVTSKGIFAGTSYTTFSPDMEMNRAMLVTTLYRYSGSPAVTSSTTFTDVDSNRYYADAVAWAEKLGITYGTGDNRFEPNASVTREQIMTMLYRLYGSAGWTANGTKTLSDFTDGGTVSGWAKDAAKWALSVGVINGYGNGTLQPTATANRAEVAQIYYNLPQATA